MNTTTGTDWRVSLASKPPADLAADLRDLADLAESDPFMAAIIQQLFMSAFVFPLHSVHILDRTGREREIFAEAIRRIKPLATGPLTKDYTQDFADVHVPLRVVEVRVMAERAMVCERVVTGTEEITEEVPDPEYIASAPTIKKTSTVETVEWRCGPILGAEPSGVTA